MCNYYFGTMDAANRCVPVCILMCKLFLVFYYVVRLCLYIIVCALFVRVLVFNPIRGVFVFVCFAACCSVCLTTKGELETRTTGYCDNCCYWNQQRGVRVGVVQCNRYHRAVSHKRFNLGPLHSIGPHRLLPESWNCAGVTHTDD